MNPLGDHPLPLGDSQGIYWCMGCHGRFPVPAMTYSNPTVENDTQALCGLLEPMHLCRGCVGWLQYRIMPHAAGWRRRAPEAE